MAEVGAQKEGPLTLTQIGSIRKNFLAEAKMGGNFKDTFVFEPWHIPY